MENTATVAAPALSSTVLQSRDARNVNIAQKKQHYGTHNSFIIIIIGLAA